jgi:hypothetical protein
MSPVNGILLLKAAEDHVGSKRGGVHGSKKGQLKIFMVIAESVEEDDLDLIQIDQAHIGDPHMHGKNLIHTIIEGHFPAIAEIKSLFEQA